MKLREQGVALLVVLLILSLMVTIAAVIAERNGRTFFAYSSAVGSAAGKVGWLYGRDDSKTNLTEEQAGVAPENASGTKLGAVRTTV